jgi:hypothetical protein
MQSPEFHEVYGREIAIKDLTEAGAEIRHLDISVLRRSVI